MEDERSSYQIRPNKNREYILCFYSIRVQATINIGTRIILFKFVTNDLIHVLNEVLVHIIKFSKK